MSDTHGLREFASVISDFRRMSSLGLKGVMVAPAVYAAAKLAPPPGTDLVVVTTLLQFGCAVWLFQFWNALTSTSLERRMKIAAVGFLVTAASCFVMTQTHTVGIGSSKDKVVIGYTVLPEIKTILSPTFTADDALRGYQYDPEKVWTQGSIMVMQCAICGSWVVAFLMLTTFMGAFVLLQRRSAHLPMPGQSIDPKERNR